MEVHINGLYPKSKCRIYYGKELLLEENADEYGCINMKLRMPRRLRNKLLRLTSNLPGVIEPLSEDIKIDPLGIFHVANPVLDISYVNDQGEYQTPKNLLNPSTSTKQMANIYRAARHRNHVFQAIQWTIILGSPFLGLLVVGWIGVVVGLTISLASYFLSPYSDGIKKAF
ncbi:hypothetical protein [Leptolyngbya sp. PCC 6406]|uniref:hypothetical protein n=1 Tax=Leptolyngbya sp. PCC 6406 TaxID=1173264 RepID=UPI000486CA86|nr:hypothetical protein [Leptolyngbya sp. PCC 6406]